MSMSKPTSAKLCLRSSEPPRRTNLPAPLQKRDGSTDHAAMSWSHGWGETEDEMRMRVRSESEARVTLSELKERESRDFGMLSVLGICEWTT